MTIERPIEDDVTALQQRVERARGRLAYQFDPALTQALSEEELQAERELAERIRHEERGQRWKEVQAAAAASDRARQTTEAIEKADMRDLLLARRAIAAQRRESSPHAKLASLYRHRAWSLRALAGVVAAGMLWSAVNVQQNIAPGGPSDPLWWFSYLLEAMISVCLIIIMIGTNKVAEWGVIDNRYQVLCAELALLGLTVSLNTYPYVRAGDWYDAAVHAVAPVMIGVALLIHDAVSARYGLAIARATAQVREMPDPGDQIRMRMPAAYRGSAITELGRPPVADEPAELEAVAEYEEYEVVDAEDELPPEDPDNDPDAAEAPEAGKRAETRAPQEVTAFRSAEPVPAQAVGAQAGESAGDAPERPAARTDAKAAPARPALDDDAPTIVTAAIDPDAPPPAEVRRAPARKTAKAPAKTAAAKAAPAKAAPAKAAKAVAKAADDAVTEKAEAPKRAAKTARTAKTAAAEEGSDPAPAAPKKAAEAAEPVAAGSGEAVTPAGRPPATRPAATRAAEPAEPAAPARPVAAPAAVRVAEPAPARPAEPAPASRPAAARATEPAAAPASRPAAARATQPAARTQAATAARAASAQPAARAASAQPAARAASAQPAARAASAQPVSRSATARATAPVEAPRPAPEADRPAAPVISFASKAASRPSADREPLGMPMMPIEPTPSRPRTGGPLAAVRNKAKKAAPEPEPTPISATSEVYDTGALRVADMLEQELAELREKRRQQRAAGRGRASSRDY